MATCRLFPFALVVLLAHRATSQSSGCGKQPPSSPGLGSSANVAITVDGISRKYRVHLPKNYKEGNQHPVIFCFHGWGETAEFIEQYMGFTSISESSGVIMVYPEGRSDYGRQNNNGWQSWNAVGSTTTLGDECNKQTSGYCYESCKSRSQGCGRCDWTSCADDTTLVEKILDTIEDQYCVDKNMVYATGYSNGGMMAYQVGIYLTSRFAAVVPGGGQPHPGHNSPPDTRNGGKISIMDLHGTRDRVCPPNGTTSSDGWNYEVVDTCMKTWAVANSCSDQLTSRYATEEDGQSKLYCVKFGSCDKGVDIVRCSYDAGHAWLGPNNNGGPGARVAWWFMRNHPKVNTISTT